MRRVVAVIGAMCLVVPLGLNAASPAGTSAHLTKLSPVMRLLVARGGYPNTSVISKAVRGFVKGNVYYLAGVRGPIDAELAGSLKHAGATLRAAYPEISWVALRSPVRAISAVARLSRVRAIQEDEVQRILDLDVRYGTAAAASGRGNAWGNQSERGTGDVRADAQWSSGITGSGVTIGVTDTGADSTHPDLDDQDWLRWGATGLPKKLTRFWDCQSSTHDLVKSFTDIFAEGLPVPPESCIQMPGYDDNGHGTHVAGTAGGSANGATAAQRGMYPGMAPGAEIAAAKVCTAGGTCLNSNVMSGMRMMALEKAEGGAGADVINMSLGGSRFVAASFGLLTTSLLTNDDPEAQLLNALSQIHNVIFSVAAGNSGPSLGSVGNPASASQAMTVGASVNDFDLDHPTEKTQTGAFGNVRPDAPRNGAIGIAGFSSRGPSGDRLVKPDLVAPGAYVIAAESAQGAEVGATDRVAQNNFSSDPTYAVLSGTSMAAPSAAGSAALVIDGYRQAAGESPLYYQVKAALANTAGTKAFEGPVAGLLGSILAKLGAQTVEDRYPIRNASFVGESAIGAGRINVHAAIAAITSGVIVYTPQTGALDNIHELQPSWAMDDVAPGGDASTTFTFHGGPKMQTTAPVTFTVESGPEPLGVNAAPASWFVLPRSVTARGGADVPVSFGLRVPAGAAPGHYNATIIGTVKLGPATQRIRIPVQFFVRLAPQNGRVVTEGPVWASDTTDYTIVGAENPIADITTDWTMIPLRLTEGTKKLELSVFHVKETDQIDIFVFDSNGEEIDSTVSESIQYALPAGALYLPSTREFPNTVTIEGDLFDGEWHPKLPTTVWIAVSDSGPANAPGFATYRLTTKISGGKVEPAPANPAPIPAPQPGPGGARLPATGVGEPVALPVSLLAGALAVAFAVRPRRKTHTS